MENTCVSPCCLCELVMKAVIGADTRTCKSNISHFVQALAHAFFYIHPAPYHLNNRNAAVNRYWLGQPRPGRVRYLSN